MIPGAAVEAAKAVLLGYTGGCVCHEGYTGRNLLDPDCVYHDVPPEVATLILEAAAQHMLAAPERASEDELVNVLRSASPDGYRPPSLRELAQAIVAAGYTRPAS